jgi:hypothetical protein
MLSDNRERFERSNGMNELQRRAITAPAARAYQVNPSNPSEHFKSVARSPYGATVGLTVNR